MDSPRRVTRLLFIGLGVGLMHTEQNQEAGPDGADGLAVYVHRRFADTLDESDHLGARG